MGTFKKGDWVRATANWLDIKVGDLCKVLHAYYDGAGGCDVFRHGVDDTSLYMNNGEIEPWVPAVGDRVRVIGNEVWAGVGVVYEVVGCVVYVKMLDGRHVGHSGGFPLDEVEPVIGEQAVDNDTQPETRLSVTISADTSALDAEIDRVKRRLKKLAKRARKLGITLEFSDIQDAA